MERCGLPPIDRPALVEIEADVVRLLRRRQALRDEPYSARRDTDLRAVQYRLNAIIVGLAAGDGKGLERLSPYLAKHVDRARAMIETERQRELEAKQAELERARLMTPDTDERDDGDSDVGLADAAEHAVFSL